MKKMTKKLGAIVLALAMCFSLCCTAIAADVDGVEYKITIQNSMVGQTYNVYKIFDATSNGDAVAYTLEYDSPWKEFIETGYTYTVTNEDGTTKEEFAGSPFVLTNNGSSYTVTYADGKGYDDAAEFISHMDWSTLPEGAGSTIVATGEGNGGELVLDVGGEGYYFITTTTGSVVSITTAAPTATVIDKNTTPGDLKKQMYGLDSSTAGTESGTTAIGDEVKYEVTANVPLYAGGDEENPNGYLVTDYEFDDQMDHSLSIDHVEGEGDSETIGNLTSGVDYTVTEDADGTHYLATASLINTWVTIGSANDPSVSLKLVNEDGTDNCAYNVKLELIPATNDDGSYMYDENDNILFDGFTLTYDTWTYADDGETVIVNPEYPVDATISIDYYAHMNEATEYTDDNTIEMIWHKTPVDHPDYEHPGYEGNDKDRNRILDLDLDITKIDATTEDYLEGAVFQLEGTNLHDVVISTTIKYDPVEGMDAYQAAMEAGTTLYFELETGEYTTVNPYSLDPVDDADELAKYVNNGNGNNPNLDPDDPDRDYIYTAYTQTVSQSTELVPSGDSHTVTGTTDSNGKVNFNGLTVGEYTLTEITAPDGYNLLSNEIKITVEFVPTTDSETGYADGYFVVTVEGIGDEGDNFYDGEGVISLTIENNQGTELPGTGGIGTTIFYIIGGVLVVGAVVVLVTRRRVNREA